MQLEQRVSFKKSYEELHRQNNEVRCKRVSKTMVSGQMLGGAEIAKREYHEAQIPYRH